MLNRKQYYEIMKLIKDKEQWQKLRKYYNIISVYQLDEFKYNEAINILKKHKKNDC